MKTPPKLKVINLWAGPGAGKSTTAAGLFNLMKQDGKRVELVTEVAKDLTYDGDTRRLENQLLILGQQYDRLDRVAGQVDYAITDSPLPLGVVYLNPKWRTEAFVKVVREAFGHFDNVNAVVKRVKPYQQYGRTQTETEARALDEKIGLIIQQFAPLNRIEIEGKATAAHDLYRILKAQGAIS